MDMQNFYVLATPKDVHKCIACLVTDVTNMMCTGNAEESDFVDARAVEREQAKARPVKAARRN